MAWEDKVHNILGSCTRTFASTAPIIHAPIDFDRQEIKGIWSDTYITADPETGMQIMTSEPNIGVRLADFDREPKKNDPIYRGDDEYRIRAVEPDGQGGATLVLERIML